MTFKLTYATMFDPPEEFHANYEGALETTRAKLGQDYGMLINGEDRFTEHKFKSFNPANTKELLGTFQTGKVKDARDAIAAAKAAFPAWSQTPYQKRVELLRKAAELIDQRVYEIGAAISLEVGKNRMEALGDIAETADLIRYACDQIEQNNGYVVKMGSDPLKDYTATNVSVLKPYGVWLVISPFNFPAALSGGPVGAALVLLHIQSIVIVMLRAEPDASWT